MTDDYTPTEGEAEQPQRKPNRRAWLRKIEGETAAHKEWREQARDAECAYQGKPSPEGKPAPIFPIFWATVQVTHAAIFARPPKPDVRKRYGDSQGSQNRLAMCIERALSYTIDTTDFSAHGHRIVDDFLVAGCGIAKVEMDADKGQQPVINPATAQPIIGEDGQPLLQDVIVRQSLRLRHFPHSRFRWEPGKDWEQCDWVAFDHHMTGAEIRERFGVDVRKTTGDGNADGKTAAEKYARTYTVHEIWDRKARQVLFLSDCHDDWLETGPFPFQLQGDFPCPKPAFLGLKSDELVPTPDYVQIKAQCELVNRIAGRIRAVTKQIKASGFYDAQLTELAGVMNSDDGTLVSLKNMAERLNMAGSAGLGGVMAYIDNRPAIEVLRELVLQLEGAKQQIYETLGIADIVRGATQASETATAQSIKGQWANVRIGPKMQALAMFFRDVFRIMAEIVGEHFEPQILSGMTGIELQPEELQQLKDDVGRTFAIDVETDSTMAADEYDERNQRLEFLNYFTDFAGKVMPQVQAGMLPADMANAALKFAAESFKHGRVLEDALAALPDSAAQLQGMGQQLQQAQQQIEQQAMELERLQALLSQVNEREEARADAKTGADVVGKQAEAFKDMAFAAKAQTDASTVVAQPL